MRRTRLGYANVMSSAAVFLLLGGAGAFAAAKIGAGQLKGRSVGSKQLQKNSVKAGKIRDGAVYGAELAAGAVGTEKLAAAAVTTGKIAEDAVTGAKVEESTLSQVPSAAAADSVDGQTVLRIFGEIPEGTLTQQAIATFAGFTLSSSCGGAPPQADINLTAPKGIAVEMAAQGNGDEGPGAAEKGPFFNARQGVGPLELALDRGGMVNDGRGQASFSAALAGGTVLSGEIGFDHPPSFDGNPTCVVYGHVIVGAA